MLLEETWKYETVSGITVRMRWKIDDIWLDFCWKIMDILNLSADEYFDNLDKIEERNHILSWLTNDDIMPGGYWHQESGKCLGWNTGWVVGNWEKYKKFIKGFDIKIKEFNIASNSKNYIEAGLSNLSRYPFDFNWIPYASIEAFWQSLKFEEWSPKWIECLDLFWVESKKYWKNAQAKKYFTYNKKTYKVWSKEHQQLMKMALREQLKQNKEKLNLLLLTGNLKLIHQPKKKDWTLSADSITIPGEIFSQFLMELREEFRANIIPSVISSDNEKSL